MLNRAGEMNQRLFFTPVYKEKKTFFESGLAHG